MAAYFALLVPVITRTLENLIMGGRQSRPGPDVNSMMRSHEQAMQQRETAFQEQQKQTSAQHQQQLELLRADMERREVTFREQHSTMNTQHQQQLQEMKDHSAREQQRIESAFQKEQAQIRTEMETERNRYEERIQALATSMELAEQRVSELHAELEKPIKNRQAKLDFVNGLKLQIQQSESLLLVGPKGMGKSTFLWLLNRGEKPKQSFSDGTVEILQLEGFVDSIGLRGWTPEELVKLLVLMIYDGIPKDLIIFGNDRIDLPVTSLGLLGINNPMIVIISSDFWRNYAPPAGGRKRINLLENGDGVRKVQPVEDLDLVYNLQVYNDIKEFGLGKPITHHDNIDGLVGERYRAGVRPFKFLLETLGNVFSGKMDNDSTTEALFRFIYVYEKKYNKDRLKFMNNATLQDFATLD